MDERWTDDDRAAMRAALDAAERGRGFTSPNPLVGAVVVAEGEIVATGFHERWGAAHAEVVALDAAGARARGATLYVTLEPCCVWGKTPPCTEAILRAGIARVVAPVEDPNPEVAGRGFGALEAAGLDVRVGLMRDEAVALNAPYFKWRRTRLPHVLLKLAVSLDGRIASAPGGDRWISSAASRSVGHEMRAVSDAVMIGIGTVLADDPRLTDRRNVAGARQPARIVVDSSLRIPLDASLVTDGAAPTIVACRDDAGPLRQDALEDHGLRVWRLPSREGRIELTPLLRRTAAEGFLSVLCEGGRQLATSLLREELVDEVAFFVAPRIVGEGGPTAVGDLGPRWLGGRVSLEDVRWTPVGTDRLLRARVARSRDGASAPRRGGVECSRAS